MCGLIHLFWLLVVAFFSFNLSSLPWREGLRSKEVKLGDAIREQKSTPVWLCFISGDVRFLCQSTLLQQGEPLLLEPAVHGPMHYPLRIYVDRCVAAVDSDPSSRSDYEFKSNHGFVVQCVSKHYWLSFLTNCSGLTNYFICSCRRCLIDSMFPYTSSKFHSRPNKIFSGSV